MEGGKDDVSRRRKERCRARSRISQGILENLASSTVEAAIDDARGWREELPILRRE